MYYCSINSCQGVSLTFDDGPASMNTQKTMDSLEAHGMKGCFFVVGNRLRFNRQVLSEIHRRGHEIGNHTYSHHHFEGMSPEAIETDIRLCSTLIADIVGFKPRVFRPPYGFITPAIDRIARTAGMDTVLWSVDTRDWDSKCSTTNLLVALRRDLRKGSIVLYHDIQLRSLEILEETFKLMSEQQLYSVSIASKLEQIKKNGGKS